MLIAGAGGHAIEILEILLESFPEKELVFFDDVNEIKKVHDSFLVIKDEVGVRNEFKSSNLFCLGVGSISSRKLLYDKLILWGGELTGVRSRSAEISVYSKVDKGVDICKHVFVSSLAEIGVGTLINTGAKIHHDVKIGNFCEISPGAMILGGSNVGSQCTIGSGAIILPKIIICENTLIGAGAVVTRSITEPGTYVGNPAKRIK